MGLLVTLVAGFEHVHRRHELYALTEGERVTRVWQADEGAGGPRWSSTRVAPSRTKGRDLLLHFDHFDFGGVNDDDADTWKLAAYRWNAKARRLESTKKPPPVHLAIVGAHEQIAAARAALERKQTSKRCLTPFSVLSSNDFPRLKPGLYVIAAPSSKRALARAVLASAKKCSPALDGYVKRGQ